MRVASYLSHLLVLCYVPSASFHKYNYSLRILTMAAAVRIAGILLGIVAFGTSLPSPKQPQHPHHRHVTRQLLGSNFGVANQNAAFDYVIIGGGTAGLTLAARLTEDPANFVAVVEAGSFYELTNGNLSQLPADDVSWASKDPTLHNPPVDWGFNTTPQAVRSGISRSAITQSTHSEHREASTKSSTMLGARQ